MELQLNLGRTGRLGAEAYQQLREAILDGRLAPGQALPATRVLATRLAVSRNTVLGAYERLRAEGFLSGRAGSGTYVAAGIATRGLRAPSGAGLRRRATWRPLEEPPSPASPAPFDLRLGTPDPGLFPWETWRRLVARQLRGPRRAGGYTSPEGDPRLRAAVARSVGASRGVRAGADDVVVCSGAQQAFDLVARVLAEPGEVVAVEDPGYPPARQAFEAHGLRVAPVPVDAEGLVVSALPETARLVYVTPSHQFPLGTPMSLSRRIALLDWAARRGAAILEDDYDAEFRFDGRPLEPLQALDRRGRVVYVGTFSKVLSPSLRLGYLVAPAAVLPALRAARRLSDGGGPPALQRALAELIEEGLFTRHLRRLHRVYRARRDRLARALDERLGGSLERLPSAAGLHLSARCRDRRLDVRVWVARALEQGVAIEALGPYGVHRRVAGLAFGYGLIDEARIEEAVERLARALPERRRASRGARASRR